MFINPREAITNNWIVFPEWMDSTFQEKCIQPNAIDFTVDKLFSINPNVRDFQISENHKVMRQLDELCVRLDGTWRLNKDITYDGISDFYVNVPEGVAAFIVVRSTFNRNGVLIFSGLYDSGYSGHVGFVVYNHIGQSYIAQHTRIGQIVFVKSENSGLYAGSWNHDQGTHYTQKGSIQ